MSEPFLYIDPEGKKPKASRREQLIWLGLALFFLALQPLNFSGFCYSDLRWYDKRELLDIYLFGKDGLTMTEAEKIRKLKDEKDGVYPDCCWIDDLPPYWDENTKYWNFPFGYYRLGLETNFLTNERKSEPYLWGYHAIDACGKAGSWDVADTLDESYYKTHLEINKEYWEGKRK